MIIALTCFNRLHTLQKTVESLMKCKGIEKVPIYYFCDYGEDVTGVRIFVNAKRRGIDHVKFRTVHFGLRLNTEAGIKEAFNYSDKVIWLQDDMEFSGDFLEFMEFALDEYENDPEIMYVSGYSPVLHHSLYLSSYFSEAVGMWKHKFDLQLQFGNDSEEYRRFAGDMAHNQLLGAQRGKDVISAYLNYSMFENNAYCLHPNKNKLRHLITDSINCKAKDAKKLNQNLYEGFSKRIDSGIMPIPYQYSPIKKVTRWLRNINIGMR